MTLKIKDLKVEIEDKEILHGISCEIKKGEVVALMGPNGSGKSTLAQAIMGNPKYTITQGSITVNQKDITHAKVDQRAKAGVFLSFQYPEEIEGVTVMNFLRTAYIARHGKISVIDFYNLLKEKMQQLKIGDIFAKRYVNVGFSGGEKKKLEILQLAILHPEFAILDETDSGTDVDALKTIAQGINKIKENMGILIITHYTNILKYVQADRVIVMQDGIITKEATPELAQEIQEMGFDAVKKVNNDDEITNILKTVEDPELHIDVVSLGLIYNIEKKEKDIKITMTFTSPMCPFGPQLVEEVKDKIQKQIKGSTVEVELTFDPPWTPTEEIKTLLGVA